MSRPMSRTAIRTSLFVGIALAHHLAAAPADGLAELLADVRSGAPRAAGAGPVAWADLSAGRLTDGTPIVSRFADEGLVAGTRAVVLGQGGLSTLGACPGGPGLPGYPGFEVLAAGQGAEGRIDLLVDDDAVVTNVAVPAGRFTRIALASEAAAAPGSRIEIRLARGSAPVAVLGFRIDTRPAAVAPRIASRAGTENIPIFPYYPLDLNLQWQYQDEADGNKKFFLKVVERTTHAGAKVAKVKRMDKQNEYDLIGYEGALKLWMRNDDINGGLNFSDAPVPFSQGGTVKIGDKYEAIPKNYVNPVTGGNLHWIIVVTKQLDVTVPLATYKACLQLDVKNVDTKSGAEISKLKMFLAQGVGVVWRQGRFISTTFNHKLISR